MNLAPVRRQHRFAIWHESVTRHQVARVTRFLLVALDRQLQPVLFARHQVANAQAGLIIDASSIDELRTIGRDGGAKAAAQRVGDGVFVARLAIAPRDLRERKIKVVVGVKELLPLGVIKIFAVPGSSGPDGVRVIVTIEAGFRFPLRDLNARAAANVIHPQLERTPGKLRLA